MHPDATFDDAVAFHGHACPGLAIGYRVARAAMARLESDRPADEELVAVVQNDSCAVDAVQLVCGCTFGKGNLVFLDHGKHAYTFHCRSTGRGVRLYAEPFYLDDADDPRLVELFRKDSLTPAERKEKAQIMDRRIQRILTVPEEEFLRVAAPRHGLPEQARVFDSIRCEACGERVMATRIREQTGRTLCRECMSASQPPTPA